MALPLKGANQGKDGSSFGRFSKLHWRAIVAIILVVVLLVISIASSIISLISALMSEENNSDAGSYITVTLYVQATDMSNKPLKDVVVDLKPTKKNKDGSEIKMPATDKEGTSSVVLSTSGGAADAPGQGQTVYLSCSYYNDVGGTHCGPHTQIGVCAADPYIIPHGSVIYVQAVDPKTLKPNGKVYGYAEATDTGGFLTKKYNNKLTSKGQAYNGHKQGVYDEYGGKIYKRAVDLWMPSEQGNHWGTRLCAVTIVKKTNPGCWDSKYCGPGGEKGKEQQGSNLNNLYSYRAGSTILPNGNLSDAVKYGDYVVSCTGGLNSKQGSNSLNVDTLVNGDPQVITVAGGKLKFWVEISSDDGTGAGSTNYLAWAKKLADNPRVGYIYGSNHGSTFKANSDVDCSSLVYWSLKKTGYLPKEKGCFSTSNEPSVLLRNGFKQVKMNQLKPGDILWKSGHTEIYVGGKSYSFGAHRNIDGVSGKGGNGGHSNSTAVTEVGYAAGKQTFTLAFRAPS